MEQSQITASQALKSRKNFETFFQNADKGFIAELLSDYPEATGVSTVCELTQSHESLSTLLEESFKANTDYLFWIFTNEKDQLINSVKWINSNLEAGKGIFLIKAFLRDDKIEFEPFLKPSQKAVKSKSKSRSKTNTTELQYKYWSKYAEICDKYAYGDLQIIPEHRHYQYLKMGKAGVSILLTINTQTPYVACELMINNNKDIFYSLLEHKEAIEKKIGKLDWQELKSKKSSKIRKVFEIDITDEANFEEAAKAQQKMALAFKGEFSKYLTK